MKTNRYLFILVILFITVSCDNLGIEFYPPTKWEKEKIAVIIPFNESDKERYTRTADWFLDNFEQSQLIFENGVKLELEWFDESTSDMKELAKSLAEREDISAVVGPKYSNNADEFAKEFADCDKPLIVPIVSSEDVIRRYSASESGTLKKSPFFWAMTEADISQIEVLLSVISSLGCKSVSLLSCDDVYGKTFYEWIPFLSKEMYVDLVSNIRYSGKEELTSAVDRVMQGGAEYVICVCKNPEDATMVSRLRNNYDDDAPKLIFSDSALSSAFLEGIELNEGIEGVTMYADPASGFALSYEIRFKEMPLSFEAQFYDALLLAGVSNIYSNLKNNQNLNDIIRRLTTKNSGVTVTAWDKNGLRSYLSQLINNDKNPIIRGASGEIRFDENVFTSILKSTYIHWTIYNGEFLPLGYLSSDSSNRIEGALASWRWNTSVMEELDSIKVEINYDELKDKKALLIASSLSWNNYRHQADVLNVYSMLKKFGWSDDDIILIMNDDIAFNEKNPNPGVIRASHYGENLYNKVTTDYILDNLDITDINDILLGNSSEDLPIVLESNSNTNVFIYWSGHGEHGSFIFKERTHYRDTMFRNTISKMSESNRFRKMLICAEPCFSGSMIKMTEGFDGILGISSSNEYEYSFADTYSITLGTWLSNRFTNNLVNSITKNPEQTYTELYKTLTSSTLGSHVSIFNESRFGNMAFEKPSEFFVIK